MTNTSSTLDVGSGQHPQETLRLCPSAYETQTVLEKTSSIQFLPHLSVLGLDINVCSLSGHFWCQIVGSFPHEVRGQLGHSHYMHTHSPPFWRTKNTK